MAVNCQLAILIIVFHEIDSFVIDFHNATRFLSVFHDI